ncbi:MAG: tyrosine--tRNA ligase, partial [Planctomycetota bacterium]
NLVPIMLLTHFQRAGHTPVVVMGGGTGLIGDPSGKEAERQLRTPEEIERNVAGQRPIFERALSFEGHNGAVIVNNLDWLGKLGYIEALRDIGKHFSVNMMIQKESVKDRLHHREQGISYTEFSYMILQAYDFLRLYEDRGVTVQVGGSDQWGNIVAGCDLIRRTRALRESPTGAAPAPPAESFGLTAPLVTKADGGKFGKTEAGAVWLSPGRTSPYAFYQFWLNTADDDVERYLKLFTLMPVQEIDALVARHARDPGAREAQRTLAERVTRLIHGVAGLESAETATRALFTGDVAALDERALREVFAEVPTTEHDRAALAGGGVLLVDLLPGTSLARSKREAREFLTNGAVTVNGERVGADARLTDRDLLPGGVILLRRGKKTWHVTRWA